MGRADFFAKGAFNRICDRCGEKRKSYDTKLEWTGLIVCFECWDPRHPQDFLKARPDRQAVPSPRPDPTPVFREEGLSTPEDSALPIFIFY